MKTLRERIEECKKITVEIMANYPEVGSVSFYLQDCEIDEIKEFDSDPRVATGRLRGLVNSYQGNCTVWANTPPFKSIKPLEYEF